jgi:hypothetical protein
MYLARKTVGNRTRYYIRQSRREGRYYVSRDLLDLGTDPAQYIVYPGGNAYYIDEVIEEQLQRCGVTPEMDELDEVFWPFIKPDIRRLVEPFRERRRSIKSRSAQAAAQEASEAEFHIFDKRRICYLKFGRTDQTGIGRVPAKVFRVLQRKSRDEIEQLLMEMEAQLSPREYKNYTFVIFDIRQHYSSRLAVEVPQVLNQEEVDNHFIEELCRLNRDRSFWAGLDTENSLHSYLRRYLLMHFDYDYPAPAFEREYVRDFKNRHRRYHPPPGRTVSLDEASSLFGEKKDALQTMSRRSLSRLYRRKAQALHPDKGGDHEAFIKLTEAYRELVRRKK